MTPPVELVDAPETVDSTAPEPQYVEKPVEDADPSRAKDLAIVKSLFPDDEKPEPEQPPHVDTKLPSPPAQRKREQEVAAPKVDAMGRAHRADGTVMSRAEQDAAQQTPAAPVAPAPAATPEPVANVPLEFMVYGAPVTMEGALYKPGHGAFFPEARMIELRQTFSRAHKYPKVIEENERLRGQVSGLYSRKEAEADAVLQTVGTHFQTPDALHAFAQQVLADPSLAMERLQLAIGRKQLELERNVQAPDFGASTEAEPEEIAEAITDEMETFFRDPQYGLTGQFTLAEQNALRQLAFQRSQAFLTVVDRDLDEQGNPIVSSGQKVSLRKGETLVNRAALLAELRYVAQNRPNGSQGSPATPVAPAARTAGNGAAQSVAPASARPAPPSAVGRSRAQVPSASQPGTGRRTKDTIPNHSIAAAAKYLFDDE